MRSGRADFRPEGASFEPERANMRPERAMVGNVWSEWAYLRLGRPRRGQSPVEHREPEIVRWLPEKADFRSFWGWGG